MNGHTLDRGLTSGTYHGYVIVVDDGELTIQDSSEGQTGKITGGNNGDWRNADSAGGGIYVDLNGTLNFAGGQITGNKAYSGGGVYVAGTMNMTGGKITGNEATATNSDGGGGVKIVGGTFKMSAGEISNNTAPRYGAGISVWSTSKAGYFEMSGGKISGNHFTEDAVVSTSLGGGIYVRCSNVVLKGGEISGNNANMGAGIYLKGDSDDVSTLNMSNTQISNNTATSSGGGIYAENHSKVTLQSGSIKENKAGDSGAGVSFGSLSHGEIADVTITGNTLTNGYYGAGISTSDDVKISGSPRIENNTNTSSKPSNVYLWSDSAVLKVVGALGENAAIGIANGGSRTSHYAAVGSNYTITDSDQAKFSSDDTDYAVKPLNTEVEGNRVELGEAGTVTLQSNNVTVASVTGTATLTQKGDSTKAWKKADFVFTITPAEGCAAKTDKFSVEYKPSNSSKQTLAANEDGTYTITVNSRNTDLYVNGIERQYTVSFETNGGSSVDAQKMFSGSKVTEPETTREGYKFEGWYSDKALETVWDFDTVVTDDITLYAKWTAIPYTVSGTVTGSTDEDMTGTVVKLMQDNEVVKEITVDNAAGQFSFSDVTIGNYNIFAVKGERRASLDLEVKENKAGITLQLPDNNIKIEVIVDENTPKTTVVGLDDLAKDYAPEQTSADVVRIVLNVAGKEESALPEETVSAIKNLSGSETLSYLDMDIERYVNGTKVENITDTGDHVQSITIDFDTARKNISVYRVHNGTAAKLTVAGSTPADGTYRVNDSSITIYATKFSTYAIGYTTKSSGGHSSSSGSTATTYPVDVKSVTNGTIKADKSTASKDSTVTITVTPDKGYELGKLTVTDKNGKTISVTAKGNGQYTFTMPAGSVTVTASFVETDWNLAYRNCPKDSTCPIWPFTDAKTTDWYHDGVHFCLENGLMVGYGNNIFQPDAGTTRAMITVMLWRLNGSPVVNYAMNFEDVKADAWYTEAIRWAASEGVAAGYGNGKFGPDDAMTREQMVTILWRYAQYKGYDVSVGEDTNILSYDDAATVAQYAVPAMQWACGSGMVTGKTQGSGMILDPKGSTTRAQMATMMMRFCAEIVK